MAAGCILRGVQWRDSSSSYGLESRAFHWTAAAHILWHGNSAHSKLVCALLLLIAGHTTFALVHRFVLKDDILDRMSLFRARRR